MKKIIFTIAAVLLTAIGSSHASAEMLTLTSTSNGSFTFDSVGAGDNLITANGQDGLSDIAFFLNYQTGGASSPAVNQFVELAGGTGTVNGNTGQFIFDQVGFSNGVSVDAVANFRLVDATPQGLGHHVVYDLSLQTTGVSISTEGSLQSFVGFDFNGNDADAVLGNQIISGFGESDVAIGADDGAGNTRILTGDFTFPVGQGSPLTTIAASNTNIDFFNGPIGANLDRFDGDGEFPILSGDLAFGSFNDFLSRDIDQVDTTAGVFGFRSASVSATIPEPSTLMMAAMGLGMVAFRRRKRA